MKKGKNILVIVVLAFLMACNNDSKVILGKWKLNDPKSKNGEMVLTFFSKNIFTIVYSTKNEMQTVIKNSGVWKFDKTSNIIEMINDEGTSVEKYHVQILNKDSLIWQSIINDSIVSIESDLFLRKD